MKIYVVSIFQRKLTYLCVVKHKIDIIMPTKTKIMVQFKTTIISL